MKKLNKKSKYNDNIPKEVKVLFGKFYLFSIIVFLFLFVFYPLFIINNVSIVSNIFILILFPLFFLYMVIEVLKNKGKYGSGLFWLFVVIFIVTYVLMVIKFVCAT